MHKGYAFVQFTNPFDARNACHGEDGRTVLSQVLGEQQPKDFSISTSVLHRFYNLTVRNINLKSELAYILKS